MNTTSIMEPTLSALNKVILCYIFRAVGLILILLKSLLFGACGVDRIVKIVRAHENTSPLNVITPTMY